MTDHRGASTVVDVSIALLLVSASVTTVLLVTPAAPSERPDARAAAALLAGSSASATYQRTSGVGVARGTVAGLLADATVLRAVADGHGGFAASVRDATRRALRSVDGPTHVVAVWRPYPGAPLRGRIAVGERPPPSVAVDAVTVVVPLDRQRDEGGAATYRDVARRVVDAVVARRERLCHGPSRCDGPSPRRLLSVLTADLERRFPAPAVAASALRTDRVVLTVRTWSR